MFSHGVFFGQSERPSEPSRGAVKEVILSGQTLREFEGIQRRRDDRDDMREGKLNDRPVRFRADRVVVKLKQEEAFSRRAVSEGRSVADTIELLQQDPAVEYVEPDYEASAFYIPNDTYFQYQWNFDDAAMGGVEAEEAWEVSNGAGVVVAIIDTGIAYENYSIYRRAPDLAGTAFSAGYDFVNGDAHPNDDNGHGTHVAGTVAQTTGNAAGAAGLAYGATLMPIKVLGKNGSGSYSDVAAGIRFAADNGAEVINLSLGGPVGATYLEEALAYAYEKGVLIVAATGNDGAGSLAYPAAYNNYVIAVGATRYDQTKADYSNYGPGLDLVAPGGDLNIDQNSDGYGDGILQQTFGGNVRNFGYYFYQGTSMATPHVASAAALILSKAPGRTPALLKEALENNAKDLGASGYDETYGFGLLQIRRAFDDSGGPVDQPPTVSITAPSGGAVVSGLVTIAADASDDGAVTSVVFLLDDTAIGSDFETPYELLWDSTTVSEGGHTIAAQAYDGAGQTNEARIDVTIDNIEDLPPPGPVTVFADSFENGEWDDKWIEAAGNRWFQTTSRKTDGAYSADVRGNSSDNALTTIPIDLGGRPNARIEFSWFIEKTLDSGEYLAFDVSTDDGGTWTELGRLRGNLDPENKWRAASFELADLSNLTLRFRGTMNGRNEDANVDSVSVTAW